MEHLVCPICGKGDIPVSSATGRCGPHASAETYGLCAGTDLEAKDPIL